MRSVSSLSASSPDAFAAIANRFSMEALAAGDVPDLACRALVDGGALGGRATRLAPLFMLWFAIARHLFNQDSYVTLLRRLVIALRGRVPDLPLGPVTDGGLCRARERLGVRPMILFLRGLAEDTPPAPRFHGHRVLAVDGAWISVPDTRANREAFGRSRNRFGPSAWPQVVTVLLLEVEYRTPIDARVGPLYSAEKMLARDLLESVGPADLVLFDKGYYGIPIFQRVTERGACFLMPVPHHVRFKRRGPVTRHGAVLDYRARIKGRIMQPDGRTKTMRAEVRVLEVQRPGFRPVRYVTNLFDPDVAAVELVALYKKRWAIEEVFDEIKTVLCHRPAGAARTHLRSKTPTGVVQEVFALLCAHALVRRTMAQAVQGQDLKPTDLGFTASMHIILCTATVMLSAPARHLAALHQQMLKDLLDTRLKRPLEPRSCPRVLKQVNLKYAIKKVAA
jgi:hypothetical protein